MYWYGNEFDYVNLLSDFPVSFICSCHALKNYLCFLVYIFLSTLLCDQIKSNQRLNLNQAAESGYLSLYQTGNKGRIMVMK